MLTLNIDMVIVSIFTTILTHLSTWRLQVIVSQFLEFAEFFSSLFGLLVNNDVLCCLFQFLFGLKLTFIFLLELTVFLLFLFD